MFLSSLNTDHEAFSEPLAGHNLGVRWPASKLLIDEGMQAQGQICMVMWPTYALASKGGVKERWFDDLHVWTEGIQPSTMVRARIQINALNKAFSLLEQERAHRVGVTLSFGTIERCLDLLTDLFDEHQLLSHRIVVTVRGELDRLRVPSRLLSFVDWLGSLDVPVGYRMSTQNFDIELRAIEFLDPDFAKLPAPKTDKQELWKVMAHDARAVGIEKKRLVIGGLDTLVSRHLARSNGFGFGQGRAIRASHNPPSLSKYDS